MDPGKKKWSLVLSIGIGVLLLVASVSRLANLGYQGFHHDESIHCLHSWDIAHKERGAATYRYDPVYHGPFLYHWGALFQTFLPDTEAAARVPYAAMGVFAVLVFLLWGKWLGWGTCILVGALLTLSPVVNYFSRFARNDVYMTAWLAGAIVFGALYLRSRKTGYLTAASLFLVLSYCTKENSYVNNFALCSFLVGWGIWRAAVGRTKAIREIVVDSLPLVRLLIVFGCFSLFVFAYVAIDCRVSYETGLVRGLSNILTHSTSVREKTDVTVFQNEEGYFSGKRQSGGQTEEQKTLQRRYLQFGVGITLTLLLAAEGLSAAFGAGGVGIRSAGSFAKFGIIAVLYLFAAYRLTGFWSWMQLAPAEQAKWTPLGLDFLSGLVGAEKGTLTGVSFLRAAALRLLTDFAMLSAAGFLLLVPSKFGGVEASASSASEETEVSSPWGAVRDWIHLMAQLFVACEIYTLLFTSLGTNVARGSVAGLYDYIAYWFKHQTGDYRIWGAWWYYIPRLLLFELLPLFLAGVFLSIFAARGVKRLFMSRGGPSVEADPTPDGKRKKKDKQSAEALKVAPESPQAALSGTAHRESDYWKPIPAPLLFFSAYLAVFMMGVYAILNEKVPWLLTYQAFALNLFAGLGVGRVVATGGLFNLRLGVAALDSRLRGNDGEKKGNDGEKKGNDGEKKGNDGEKKGNDGEKKREDGEEKGNGGGRNAERLGIFLRWGIVAVILCLFLFTLGQHLTTVYFRPDRHSNLLVYTGTTHEFAEHARRIRRMIDQAEKEGKPKVRIALHGKGEWPSAWYFRNDDVAYKQIVLDRDIQILDDTPQNQRKMKQTGRAIWETNVCDLRGWWIWHGTPDALPGKLDWTENMTAFLFNRPNDKRRYFSKEQLPEFYPIGFRTQVLRYVFGRQVWYPTGGERVLVCYKTGERSPEEGAGYLEGADEEPRLLPAAVSFGEQGSEPGQLNQPRGLTLTPEGNVAVADSKNGRISVYSPEGEFLTSVGQGTLSAEVSGVGDVVCDPAGNYYVADTWNHQVRKFAPDGTLLQSASEALEGANRTNLFGPRGIALDSKGRVYVTDTGFCFVRVYDRDLNPLYSWGGKGTAEGNFVEPVGIAIDSKDRVYVADTGNGRIQRFDPEGNFDAETRTLELVESESVSGIEPYLEVLPDGRIVATYSNDSTVWIIDPEKGVANKFKVFRPSFEKPVGVAADSSGRIWVGDLATHKIARIELP